jgi:excinuclease ABC subunit C
MAALFRSDAFAGFGADPRTAAPRGEQIEADSRLKLKRGVRERCPNRAGVYGMVDEHGELIYVGKAKRLRPRLLSYFRTGKDAAKGRRILRRTRLIAWEYVPHELAALIRELELIRRWRPRFNVVGRPDPRKRVYVCLGRAPAPYLFLATQATAQCQSTWGPVPAGPRATLAVKTLNDVFRLRDCPRPRVPMRFADHGHLFDPELTAGCLRYEIGDCLAPCAAACTRGHYGAQARLARQFLNNANTLATDVLTRR